MLCENDTENGQRLIKGIGEQQLEIIVARLENQYKDSAGSADSAKVGYKETICAEATARCRYKKQSGGHGQFAEVQITFSPSGNREKDYVFETAVVAAQFLKIISRQWKRELQKVSRQDACRVSGGRLKGSADRRRGARWIRVKNAFKGSCHGI